MRQLKYNVSATLELNVTVDSSRNNKTVQCVLNSNSGTPTIGMFTDDTADDSYYKYMYDSIQM